MAGSETTNNAAHGVAGYEAGLEVVGRTTHSGSDGLQFVPKPQGHDKFLASSGRASFEFPEATNQQQSPLPKQDPSPPYYEGQLGHQASQGHNNQELLLSSQKQRRRCCGLPLWAFILAVVIVALVVVGAVLGGVLGTTLHEQMSRRAKSEDAAYVKVLCKQYRSMLILPVPAFQTRQ